MINHLPTSRYVIFVGLDKDKSPLWEEALDSPISACVGYLPSKYKVTKGFQDVHRVRRYISRYYIGHRL